ncbi:hypothetical protein GCM10007940_27650 [Portibacter lacus]|uniref:Transglycosylase SLT domain-containing protein n=1 Tax=Portibacter lacus TaxID=1099794 RepID=A0AA37WGT5_9BACT|nr:hypothetical protein GCM10007940_27650 [Portibacter lacus]
MVLGLLTCFFSVFAEDDSFIGTFTLDEIEQRLESLDADVDLKMTPEVKKYLQQYIVSQRQSSETLIGRSMVYFPDIEQKLLQKNLPMEIKFLSIIESSLKPEARSRVGAVGLWQFMRATARMYGLKIDKHVDERKDVDKSTEAALTYLSDLHERFGDWTLALAAYNCGPGNVRKAMRRSGGKDYWSIRNYLPRETRNYVPKFIAMTYLMNYYNDHDLIPTYPDELFVKTRKMIVVEATTFSSVSQITGLDIEEIKYYNPSYLGNHIPGSKDGRILELPSDAMYVYLEEIQGFDFLIPDALQDLLEETKVAAQLIEKRELVTIVPLVERNILENFELIYAKENIVLDDVQAKLSNPKMLVKTRQRITVVDWKSSKKEKRKQISTRIRNSLNLN